MTLEQLHDRLLMDAAQWTKVGKQVRAQECLSMAGTVETAIRERDELRKVCAATYQAAGCYGLPERFKDALSNAMHGEKLHDVDLDELLPVDPIDWVERAEKAEAELGVLKATIANAPTATISSRTGAGPCNIAVMEDAYVFDSTAFGRRVALVPIEESTPRGAT